MCVLRPSAALVVSLTPGMDAVSVARKVGDDMYIAAVAATSAGRKNIGATVSGVAAGEVQPA